MDAKNWHKTSTDVEMALFSFFSVFFFFFFLLEIFPLRME